MTQEQFAERSGFTQQYLSDLERGRRNPTVVSLFELSQALGVEHVALVTPDDEAFAEKAPRRKIETKSPSAKADNRKGAKPPSGKSAKLARRKI